MSALVTTDFEPPEVIDANGRPVHACGVVDLTWQWHPRGTRIYECPFYVLPDSEYLDVLFGVDSIVSMNLIQANPSAIVTLVEHKKLKEGEELKVCVDNSTRSVQKPNKFRRRKSCYCHREGETATGESSASGTQEATVQARRSEEGCCTWPAGLTAFLRLIQSRKPLQRDFLVGFILTQKLRGRSRAGAANKDDLYGSESR